MSEPWKFIYRKPIELNDPDGLGVGVTVLATAVASEVLPIGGATAIRVRGTFTKAGTMRVALLKRDQVTEITDPAPQSLVMVADIEGMIEFTGIIGESYALIEFTAGGADADH